jgi:hypothetical protein
MDKIWKLHNDVTNEFSYKSFKDNKDLVNHFHHDFFYKEIYNFEDSETGCVYEMWDCTINKGDVVFDLGSNMGFFSVKASELASKVISVEGSPEAYSCLVENCCHIENINTVNAIVMDKNSDYNGLWSKKGNPLRLTLEEIMDLFKIDKIDFLKCDIEGGEYDLFGNMSIDTLSKIDKIAMETHIESKNEGFFLPGKIRHSFYWNSGSGVQLMYYFVTPK